MKPINTLFKRIKIPGFLLSVALLMPISSQAATLEDVVKEIKSMRQEVLNWFTSAKDMYLDYLFEENPSYPATVAVNTSKSSPQEKVDEMAQKEIKNSLTQEKAYQKTTVLANIPASDSTREPKTNTTPSLFGQNKPETVGSGDANLDVNALIAPTVYETSEAQNTASRFIQFTGSILDPLTSINLSNLTPEQKKSLDDSPVGREYRVYLRALVAERSVAMNNLLQMYAARLPVTDLGKQAGIPDEAKKDASPLQVQEYKATRRISSPDWYRSMSKAAPVTIERESLFVLAEIREQLFRLQQDNEKILLALSLLQLQNIQANKLTDTSKEIQARKLLGL